MKILITGINGYIGSHITTHLVNNGHIITGLTNTNFDSPIPWEKDQVNIIVDDIRNKSVLHSLAKNNFDAIIHLVSLDHNSSEGELEFVNSVNVLPTWNLLDIFSKKGLKKFIYFSTQQVYGRLSSTIVTEAHPVAPVNNYGLTHLMSEDIVNMYNRATNTDAISIRLSNSYGSPIFYENNCWWLVVNDLCKTAFQEKKIQLLSDGSPVRDFIHVTDVAAAIETLLINDTKDENVFNISSGQTLSILKLAHLVKTEYKKFFGINIDVILKDGTISLLDDIFDKTSKYTINPDKIVELGFTPHVSIEQGIRSLFTYLQNK